MSGNDPDCKDWRKREKMRSRSLMVGWGGGTVLLPAAELATSRQGVASLNRKEFRLRELEQKVETDQRLYEMFFNRAKETSEATGFQTAHARIVEKAVPPLGAASQNERRNVLVAFIASLLVGAGLAIFRDMGGAQFGDLPWGGIANVIIQDPDAAGE